MQNLFMFEVVLLKEFLYMQYFIAYIKYTT